MPVALGLETFDQSFSARELPVLEEELLDRLGFNGWRRGAQSCNFLLQLCNLLPQLAGVGRLGS
jgi:hypothetical protein